MSEVTQLAQDTDGFLWVGTRGGLVRFDGHEMRTWAPQALAGLIAGLAAGPNREVIAGVECGNEVRGRWRRMALFRITDVGAEPFAGPDRAEVAGATSVTFSPDGTLWITRGTDLLRRKSSGTWQTLRLPTGEPVFRVEPSGDHDALVIAESGLWRLAADGKAQQIVSYPTILVALAVPDGSVYFVEDGEIIPGRLMRVRGGRTKQVLQLPARPISMTRRNDTVWVAFDRYLVALRSGESPEIIGPGEGLASGGPLLVDSEASLWLGTYQGLLQFPEPETIIWNHRDGLPSQHATYLARFSNPSEGFWAATWQGLGRMQHSARGWRAGGEGFLYAGELCLDRQGRLWLTMAGEFWQHTLSGNVVYTVAGLGSGAYCAAAPDGTVWLLTPTGLYRTAASSRMPQLITTDIPDLLQHRPGAVLHASDDWLWVSEAGTVCRTKVAKLLDEPKRPAWDCQSLAGAQWVLGLVELPKGELWAATDQKGVWHYKDSRWQQLTGSTQAPYQRYGNIRPSLLGGIWLLSEGGVARVVGSEDKPTQWRMLERLSPWQGVPTVGAIDLLEDGDGSVWISGVAGVIQVPASARRAPMPVPRVQLVTVTADHGEAAPATGLRLAYGQFLELHFAALSFRDRSRLRYQMRMNAGAPWQEVEEPVFRYLHLKARHYKVEVRASLDGEHWSAEPAQFEFEVLPPWYQQNWALLGFAVLVGGSLYAAYRIRLAMVLRMERQRAQIAMDLHDDMGSVLGSIRLLAGLAADENLPEPERIATANEIAEAAGEMGTSLGEIVWSLRPGSARIDALAAHLLERGARLFPGETTVFRSEIPESLPAVELSLAVRRAVAMIAIEAMHNASRHAQANHVTIGLAQQGRAWKLWVSDDGRGLSSDGSGNAKGMGLRNMQQRAKEIGAQLFFSATGDRGTTVTLLFAVQG